MTDPATWDARAKRQLETAKRVLAEEQAKAGAKSNYQGGIFSVLCGRACRFSASELRPGSVCDAEAIHLTIIGNTNYCATIWAENYDWELTDVFAIQKGIARAVLDSCRA